jgi:hypothetical protein
MTWLNKYIVSIHLANIQFIWPRGDMMPPCWIEMYVARGSTMWYFAASITLAADRSMCLPNDLGRNRPVLHVLFRTLKPEF